MLFLADIQVIWLLHVGLSLPPTPDQSEMVRLARSASLSMILVQATHADLFVIHDVRWLWLVVHSPIIVSPSSFARDRMLSFLFRPARPDTQAPLDPLDRSPSNHNYHRYFAGTFNAVTRIESHTLTFFILISPDIFSLQAKSHSNLSLLLFYNFFFSPQTASGAS